MPCDLDSLGGGERGRRGGKVVLEVLAPNREGVVNEEVQFQQRWIVQSRVEHREPGTLMAFRIWCSTALPRIVSTPLRGSAQQTQKLGSRRLRLRLSQRELERGTRNVVYVQIQ
jgi:hypothetical protein